MAMGRQGDLPVSWSELPRSPGHVFYDRLSEPMPLSLLGSGLLLLGVQRARRRRRA